MWYKSCPKCHKGDLALGQDIYGWYRECVQCGYLEDLPSQQASKLAPVTAPVPARQTVLATNRAA